MANNAVAKKGLAKMAITACIAGPMFNLLVGLGGSAVKTVLSQGQDIPFAWNARDNILNMTVSASLAIQLIFILVGTVLNK